MATRTALSQPPPWTRKDESSPPQTSTTSPVARAPKLVVLGAPATAGAGPLTTRVAAGKDDRGVLAPCGRCRQTLLDRHPDCFVVVPAPDGADCRPIHELLPFNYRYPGAAAERFVRFNSAYFEPIRFELPPARTSSSVARGPTAGGQGLSALGALIPAGEQSGEGHAPPFGQIAGPAVDGHNSRRLS